VLNSCCDHIRMCYIQCDHSSNCLYPLLTLPIQFTVPCNCAFSEQLTEACRASVKVLVQAWNLFVRTQKKLLGIFKNLMKESLARYC